MRWEGGREGGVGRDAYQPVQEMMVEVRTGLVRVQGQLVIVRVVGCSMGGSALVLSSV